MKIRPTTPQDLDEIQRWIDGDPYHAGKLEPKFFFEPRPGATHFVLLDRGEPIFYVTLEKCVRGYVQFDPEAGKLRTATALRWLAGFLRVACGRMKVTEFITDSESPGLVNALTRWMGLSRLENNYATRIAPIAEEEHVRTERGPDSDQPAAAGVL